MRNSNFIIPKDKYIFSIFFFGEIMCSLWTDKWLWITILSVLLVIALPLVVVWGILNLPADIRIVATIGIIILWGVVSGYKDWILSKERERESVK